MVNVDVTLYANKTRCCLNVLFMSKSPVFWNNLYSLKYCLNIMKPIYKLPYWYYSIMKYTCNIEYSLYNIYPRRYILLQFTQYTLYSIIALYNLCYMLLFTKPLLLSTLLFRIIIIFVQ